MVAPNMFDKKGLQPQGMMLDLSDQQAPQPTIHDEGDFYKNIAWDMPASYLQEEGYRMWQEIEKEEDSYRDYTQLVADVYDMIGINFPNFNLNSSSQSNSGSSNGNSPVRNSGATPMRSSAFSSTCLEIVLTILSVILMKDEITDMSNPDEISTEDVQSRITRVKKFSNAYLKEMLPDYASGLESTLWTAAAIGDGVRYIHSDPVLGMPTATQIQPGYFFSGLFGTDFYTSPTKTHKFILNEDQFDKLIDTNEWLDSSISGGESEGDFLDPATIARARIDGQNISSGSRGFDGDEPDKRIFYRREVLMDNPHDPFRDEDGRPQSYTWVIGQEGAVFEIKRNWSQQDLLRLPINHYVKYSMFPSLGQGGLGVAQLGGYNARAATVLQRTMIDSALLSANPSYFVKENARMREHSFDFAANKMNTLATGDSDIDSAIKKIDHEPPNPVIAQLIQDLEQNIEKLAGIVSQDLMELAKQATTANVLTIFERLETRPNSIIQRIYQAFSQELRIFQREWYNWLPEGQMVVIPWDGQTLEISKHDFAPDLKIIPAGNYSYESNAYKLLRSEWVLSQARQNPEVHNMYNIMDNLYKELGYTEKKIQSFLVPPPQQQPPFSGNPLAENMMLMTGKPVTATMGQDNHAHKIVHQSMITPDMDPVKVQTIMAHLAEHEANEMAAQMQSMIGMEVPVDATQQPMEVQNLIAMKLAEALSQKQEEQQAQLPPPPIDPGIVGLEEVKAQREIAEMNTQVAMAKMEMERQTQEEKNHIELMRIEIERNRRDLESEKERMKAEKEMLELSFKEQEFFLKQAQAESKEKTEELDRLKKTVDMHLDIKEAEKAAMHWD